MSYWVAFRTLKLSEFSGRPTLETKSGLKSDESMNVRENIFNHAYGKRTFNPRGLLIHAQADFLSGGLLIRTFNPLELIGLFIHLG